LVEDNYEIAQFIGEKLEEDYHILRANNGQVALELLDSESVQLVLSDVMMPVMDGFELCKHLKSNQQYSHIPVILLTAKNTLQAKIVGLELGADAYIEKPFSLDYLLMQISNLLINRTKVKDYFANSPLVHLKNMVHSKSDEAFLEKLQKLFCRISDNNQLDVDLLAETMNMSRPTLYRKIKAVANLSQRIDYCDKTQKSSRAISSK
jgi:DNA-binding response OmpR family regulator